jgi:hypothetical protein
MNFEYFLDSAKAKELRKVAEREFPEMVIRMEQCQDGLVRFLIHTDSPRWLFWLGSAYTKLS